MIMAMDITAFSRLGGIKGIEGDELTPATHSEITDVEKQIGVCLPKAYRQFLLTCGASTFNGASPDNPHIVFCSKNPLPSHISETSKGLFDAFYGGKRDESDPYSLQVRIQCFTGRMPESIIPIGDDGGAGQICLGIKGNEAGKVYYWDQANEPLDEEDYLEDYGVPRPPEAMFQNVYEIADSFGDFLQRLEIMEE
ncbi:SMI1/KNR4 family protein [Bremerella sp. JC817]|uniref:SMI1/KNR4 family protein n=1 Tax=Bremerella sp. JC817 TaxID=3231756 RepID=UPI00345A8ECD